MVADKIKALAATKAKVAELEKDIAAELNRELAALPAKFGFTTVAAFVKAVKSATGGKVATASAAPKKKRTRAVITDEIRAQVKTLVEEGKTGAEISKVVGISLPSVQNVKKALGLVAARA
jgi:hypothetical protein